MKAITICQPYPEMILRGDKRVENRNQFWRHRGPLLIHAGKSRERLRLNERGTVDQSGIAAAVLPRVPGRQADVVSGRPAHLPQ